MNQRDNRTRWQQWAAHGDSTLRYVTMAMAVVMGACSANGAEQTTLGSGADDNPYLAGLTNEICGNGFDDNGDGMTDERCGCQAGETQRCFLAPIAARGNAPRCMVGEQRCVRNGNAGVWGPCEPALIDSDPSLDAIADLMPAYPQDCGNVPGSSTTNFRGEGPDTPPPTLIGPCAEADCIGDMQPYSDPTMPTDMPLAALDSTMPEATGKVWHVRVSGDDQAPGDIDRPFRTISHCAEIAQPGETCLVHTGTYREAVVPAHSGTAEAPIVFRAADGEKVTVTGTEVIEPQRWVNEGNNVFSATIDLASEQRAYEPQLFVDRSLWVEARWPDLPNGRDDLLDGTVDAVASAGSSCTAKGGVIVSPDLPKIAGSWLGATVRVRGTDDGPAHTGRVVRSDANRIEYEADDPDFASICAEQGPRPGSRFFLSGARGALDTAKEWQWNASTKTLRLRANDGDDPWLHTVEVKRRDRAFDLRGRANVHVIGFRVFAATIDSDESSPNAYLANLDVRYPSHYIRLLGPRGYHHHHSGVVLAGADSRMERCQVRWSAGNGVTLAGERDAIVDSTIEYADYSADQTAPVFFAGDREGYQVLNNRIAHAGHQAMRFAERLQAKAEHTFRNSRVAFNDVSGFGALARDVGALQAAPGTDGIGTHIDHNHIHDALSKGGAGMSFGRGSRAFTVHHNVIWNVPQDGFRLGTDDDGHIGDGTDGGCHHFTINSNTTGNGVMRGFAAPPAPDALAQTYVSNNTFGGGGAPCDPQSGFCREAGMGGYRNTSGDPGFADPSHGDYFVPGQPPASAAATSIWTDVMPVASTTDTKEQGYFGAYPSTTDQPWQPGPRYEVY